MFRNREGFTLIELLIVVVIIGILAAIALPKFGQTREAAYYTTVRSDLTNLRSAQEMYYQTSGSFSYADNLDDLDFTPSSGVLMTDGDILVYEAGQGWSAEAGHAALDTDGCAIAYGDIAAATVTTPGGTETVSEANNNVGAPVCDD